MTIGLEHYLVVSVLLFALGLLVIYMSLELMLNAANLALVAFSRFSNSLDGQVFVFFIITVAAAEVSVGLALIVALYRKRQACLAQIDAYEQNGWWDKEAAMRVHREAHGLVADEIHEVSENS